MGRHGKDILQIYVHPLQGSSHKAGTIRVICPYQYGQEWCIDSTNIYDVFPDYFLLLEEISFPCDRSSFTRPYIKIILSCDDFHDISTMIELRIQKVKVKVSLLLVLLPKQILPNYFLAYMCMQSLILNMK